MHVPIEVCKVSIEGGVVVEVLVTIANLMID